MGPLSGHFFCNYSEFIHKDVNRACSQLVLLYLIGAQTKFIRNATNRHQSYRRILPSLQPAGPAAGRRQGWVEARLPSSPSPGFLSCGCNIWRPAIAFVEVGVDVTRIFSSCQSQANASVSFCKTSAVRPNLKRIRPGTPVRKIICTCLIAKLCQFFWQPHLDRTA
jgi:hypothetical protein